jgi:uncharacterized protein YeaO (DUF488 family)
MIKLKRVYDPPGVNDGHRILVDRLWPRGFKKNEVKIDEWLKDIAPSSRLRKWYSHDVLKWVEFKSLYFAELSVKEDLTDAIIDKAKTSSVTFVYAAKDKEHSNANALKEYIENKMI